MATGYTAFARHRLVCEAVLKSQNISANQSSIRGELFLQSMDAYGAINASAQGQARVTINGVSQYENGTSGLSANQKKILLSKYYTVGHNAEGNSNPAVSASFYVNVTFAGVYYGTVTVGTFGMGNLPKIPRHSSLNAVPTFTIPSGCSFSISRKSNFTHNLTFWIQNKSGAALGDDNQWTYITSVNNVATSGTFNFSADQMKTIAARLNSFNGSMQGKVKLWTNGVSGLSQQRTVEIRSPESASAKTGNFSLKEGTDIKIDLTGINGNDRFKYDIELKCAGWSKSWEAQRSSSITYTLTQADVDAIQKNFTGSTTNGGLVVSTPKIDGVQYKNSLSNSFKASVVPETSSPLIVGNTIQVADTNPTSFTITNSKESILQNLSTMQVTIPGSNFKARGYGILSKVEVSFAGQVISTPYTNGSMTFSFGSINKVPADKLLTVKITDSRGLTNATTKIVSIYPFQAPILDISTERKNHFEKEILVKGSVINSKSGLPTSFNYNIKKVTMINFDYTGPEEILLETIQNTKDPKRLTIKQAETIIPSGNNGTVTIKVYDTLGSYTTTVKIPKGEPILFINSRKENISVGALTEDFYNSTLPGVIELESERYHSSGKTGIQMNNSDISGINGLWFSTDPMDNNGEGIHFIRTGAEANVPINDYFYDYMYMRDNNFYANSDTNPLFKVDDSGNMIHPTKLLWTGVDHIDRGHTITPSKPLSQCRNGWVLLWSQYDPVTKVVVDSDFSETYISKTMQTTADSCIYRSTNVGKSGVLVSKLLYVYDNKLVGHERNTSSQENGNVAVLRRIHEW